MYSTFQANLYRAVKNVQLESAKNSYNPEVDMNWLNLPEEMQEEVVKRMDFKTRIRLSAAAKPEKAMVNGSSKHVLDNFDLMFFYENNPRIQVDFRSSREGITLKSKNFEFNRAFIDFLEEIFKKCEIRCFSTREEAEHRVSRFENDLPIFRRNLTQALLKYAPFNFEQLICNGFPEITQFFVENSKNPEKIFIDFHRFNHADENFPASRVIGFPAILNAKHLKFLEIKGAKMFDQIIQKWIDTDADIGNTVDFTVRAAHYIEDYGTTFANRFIEKTATKLRIRMNNRSKQIVWLDSGEVQVESAESTRIPHRHCYVIKVVPIDFPESECTKLRWNKYQMYS